MKKAVYITCLIFSLVFLGENINFMYAQLDDEINVVQTEENLDTDLNSSENELQQEECIEDFTEEYIEENENIGESYIEESNENKKNLDDLDIEEYSDGTYSFSSENRGINVYDVEQVTQEIDTSEYGIIRIADPNNPGKGITIHDRNLGAVTTGYGTNAPDTSYGYYYQWGNNYGFPSTGDIEKVLSYSETNIDASEYGPNNPYSSDTFIIGNNDWSHISNHNLRGGSGDSIDNGRGYPISNASDRQGPCPTGYHVPSIGEWSRLLEFWADEFGNVNTITKDGLSQFSSQQTNAFNKFYQRILIPLPNFSNYFHSSTPDILNNGLYRMQLRTNYWIWANGKAEARADGYPIRCFLNSYRLPKVITYRINGGHWSGEDEIQEKSIIYTSDDGINYIPNKELGIIKRNVNCGENEDKKCMFAGWHTLTGDELWTGSIDEDITLYAKWLPFEDKDITLSGVNLTVMDRNLGAINSGIDENAYGYYFTGGEYDILCPEGYHIPSTGEWMGIGRLLGSDFNGNYIKNLLSLPFAGKLNGGGYLENEGSGYYLADNGDKLMYIKFNNSEIEIESLDDGEKVPVRCFKDYNIGTIKFNSNSGNNIDDIIAVNWREDGEDLEKPSRGHSIFSGWYTTYDFQESSKLEKNINYKNEEEINLYAKWDCEEGYQSNGNNCKPIYFDIQRIDGNGDILRTDSVKRGDIPVYDGATPSKNSNSDYSYTFNGIRLPKIVEAFENTGYFAQFNEEPIKKSGGNSSGGGGKKIPTSNEHASASNISSGMNENELKDIGTVNSLDDFSGGKNNIKLISDSLSNDLELSKPENPSDIISKGENLYSQEFMDAYNFAYKYGIIDADSIYDAKMYSTITRIEMAKMLSNYAINVLGKKPDLSKGIFRFEDITNKLDKEYDNGVTLAYQLGIMGINMKNNLFMPNNEATRAEFTTVLSRMLYNTQDGIGKSKYYDPHMAKLYNEGIINNTDPKMKEYRGYVMVMLMRTIQ